MSRLRLARLPHEGRNLIVHLTVVALLALISSSIAGAMLVEADLFDVGDGMLTRDARSGLDWLDVTTTLALSFDDIRGDVGGFATLGFRHATGEEVCGLVSANAGGAPTPCPGGSVRVEDQRALAALVSLLGDTGSPAGPVTFGIFDDGSPEGGVGAGRIFQLAEGPGLSSVRVEADFLDSNATLRGGNFLVRAVPEPGWLSLFGFGVLTLARRRARHFAS